MGRPFGRQTIEVATVSDGAKDEWGIPDPQTVWKLVGGCRFRPLTISETVALTDQAIELWKLTAPPTPAMLAAKLNGQIRYQGDIFEIDGGIKPFPDAHGADYKVTVIAKRQQKQIA